MSISIYYGAHFRVLAGLCAGLLATACAAPLPHQILSEPVRRDAERSASFAGFAGSVDGAHAGGRIEGGLCTWTPAQATSLTLSVAIEKALCSHPKIRDARAAVNVERHQRFVALGSLLHSASATISNAQTYNNSRSLFGRSVTETKGSSSSMSFNWLLYDFGGRAAQIEAATELVIAASAGQDIALQNVFASVVDAYFQMLTSESMAEVARASIANSERAVAAAKVRSELGAATAADLQFARVGLAQAELVAARINEQLELSKGDLAASLHLDPGMPIKLASRAAERELEAQFFNERSSEKIGALIGAVENHPQIRAATARANASSAQLSAAKSEFLPKVSLAGNLYVNGRPGSSVSDAPSKEKFVGVSVVVPMFDGFSTYNRSRAAQAQHERALAQLEDARGQVKSSVWKAHQSSIMSVKSLRAADAVVFNADVAKTQARLRYQNGAGDIADWLRAEKTYFDARIDVIKAKAEIRSARLRLVLALGDLGSWTFEQWPQNENMELLVRQRSVKSQL